MNNARDTIMATLAQAGITNLTVDDVIAEFQASDELAGYLAGADDTEQVILAHLPEYLALRGFAAEVGAAAEEADPTATQGATSVPALPTAVTTAQASAIAQVVNSDLATKQMKSEQSEMVAVLIDKPYPGDWMKDIGKLHVKGDAEKVIAQMKERYNPDSDINSLLGRPDSTFIPSTAQLAQLKLLHQNDHQGTKSVPMWYDFDNDAAYNGIMNTMTSGDGTFDVLVAPITDEGEGAYKNKAWRWNTKGFAIRIPTTEAGEGATAERNVTRQSLMGLLATELAGYIVSHKENGLGCQLAFIKKKSAAGASAAAVAKTPTLRIKGNNPAANPETRPINEIGNGQGKMTVRSSAFYFAVRVDKNGKYSVKKMRVPLMWEQAPVWVRKGEYEPLFPSKVAGGIGRPDAKALQEIQDAQIALAAKIMGEGSGANRLAFGMTNFCMEIEERVNKNAAQAASEIAL